MADITRDTTTNTIGTGSGGLELDPAGTELVTINNGLLIPDGTKTEPALRFTDDTNTGIYSPVNDSVGISANGEDVIRFTGGAGSVNYLELQSSITGNALTLTARGTDTDIDIDINPKGTGVVKVGGTEIMKVGDPPTAHTHIKADITDFSDGDYATAAQGALADSAVQPGDNVSTLTNDAGYLTDITGQSIKNLSDVDSSMAPTDGQYLSWDAANGYWKAVTGSGGGASTFLDLTDTPSAYTADQWVKVNATGDALEFVTAPLTSTSSIKDLGDVSDTMAPTDGQVLAYNATNSEWEAQDASGGGGGNNWLVANNGVDYTNAPTAGNTYSIAMGDNANASGYASTAIGPYGNVVASGHNAIAIGPYSDSTNTHTLAVGGYSQATGFDAIALGYDARATASKAMSIGVESVADKTYSIAIGLKAKATSDGSQAIGDFVVNTEPYSMRIGYGSGYSIIHTKEQGRVYLEGAQAAYVHPSYADGSEPAGVAGATIYDSTNAQLKLHDGTSWNPVGGSGGGSAPDYIQIQHVEPEGTSGGGPSAGDTWETRPLNTIVTDTTGSVTLTTNEFTLPAGTYEFDGWGGLYYPPNMTAGKARLYNVTDAVVQIEGSSGIVQYNNVVRCEVRGRFTITASTTFRLEQWAHYIDATDGWGYPGSYYTNFGSHIYADLILHKVA